MLNCTFYLCKGIFTLDVCICVSVKHHYQFNIALMEMQMHTHKMGLNPFLTFYIDTMLNFDGDIDANANVKCEHTVTLSGMLDSVLTERKRSGVAFDQCEWSPQ